MFYDIFNTLKSPQEFQIHRVVLNFCILKIIIYVEDVTLLLTSHFIFCKNA
jgi:hypothetical protein